MVTQHLVETGSVALLAYRRPTDAYVRANGDLRLGCQLWLLRLADASLVRADDGWPMDTDATWTEVRDGMKQLLDPACPSVVLRDGCVLERDDDPRGT